jgi:hypothetical protein
MKQHHLLSLLQTGFITIKVQFPSTTQHYSYKARSEENIVVGDAVVVDSPRNGLVVASVVAVDERAKINTDAEYAYKWIVQKVNKEAYEALLKQEQEFLEVMQEVERENQRAIALEKFKQHLPEGTLARVKFDEAIAKYATPAIK